MKNNPERLSDAIRPFAPEPFRIATVSEGAEGDAAPQENAQGTTVAAEGNSAQSTFTLDEVMNMVQAEADKRVTAALKNQERAFEKKMSLSGLDEQQRAIAERDQQIAEQNELIRNLTIAQNRAELVKTLAGRGLPVEFAEVIEVGDDAQQFSQDAAYSETECSFHKSFTRKFTHDDTSYPMFFGRPSFTSFWYVHRNVGNIHTIFVEKLEPPNETIILSTLRSRIEGGQ